jgi:hypothetical protein
MGWLITRLAQATSVYTDDVWVADSSRSSALGPARQCTAPIWQDTPSTATAPPTPVTSGDAGCSWWPHSTACPWGRADPPRCERKGAVEITRTPTCKVGKWPLHCGLCKRSLAGTCSSKVQQQWRNPAMVDCDYSRLARQKRHIMRPAPPLCKQGVRGSSPLGSTYFPLSRPLSALADDLTQSTLQQQTAAVGS